MCNNLEYYVEESTGNLNRSSRFHFLSDPPNNIEKAVKKYYLVSSKMIIIIVIAESIITL